MGLQEALTQAGLAETKEVKIPPTWKKCEIHELGDIPIGSSIFMPLRNGETGTTCTEWENGKLTIHQQRFEHDPKRYTPALQKTLDDIQSVYPQCEILWC